MEPTGTTRLIQRISDPADPTAWQDFYRCFAPLVWSIGRRLGLPSDDAEDVVQETMIAAIQALREQRFERSKGSFKQYFRGLASHKILDRLRQLAHEPRGLPDSSTGTGPLGRIPGRETDPSEAFDGEWQDHMIRVCLDEVRREVEPTTYQAFDLYSLKEWPAEKVAGFLGISRNAVYIAKARVLARVRVIYEKMENW